MKQGSRKLCVILGAGGHACVLIDALRAQGEEFEFIVLDSDKSLHGKELLDVRVAGDDSLLHGLGQQGDVRFVIGVGGVGDTAPRQRLYEAALAAGLSPLRVRHPAAICSPSAMVGDGVQLLAGCIVNTGASIGANTIVNTGAVIEHGCRIGEHAHIATAATLCGDVVVGEGAHVGASATIKQGVVIGHRAIVGAGSVVLRDVPAGSVAVGVPAKHLGNRCGENTA
jgi:sugar O-acyltransferase (sialic acid O-acetyltransferase NeuD family)